LGNRVQVKYPFGKSAAAELRGVSVPFFIFSTKAHSRICGCGKTSCVGTTSAADPDMAFCKDEECQP